MQQEALSLPTLTGRASGPADGGLRPASLGRKESKGAKEQKGP